MLNYIRNEIQGIKRCLENTGNGNVSFDRIGNEIIEKRNRDGVWKIRYIEVVVSLNNIRNERSWNTMGVENVWKIHEKWERIVGI